MYRLLVLYVTVPEVQAKYLKFQIENDFGFEITYLYKLTGGHIN